MGEPETAQQPPLLVASGLCKGYRRGDTRIDVLAGVDLQVARGEALAITGASGAGKSTLLHLLGTLDSPDGGTLSFDGESLAGRSPAALAAFRNRSMGFVFQFHHLLPDFSALENVMMPAWIGRIGDAQARRMAVAALEEVGMAARLHHRPQALSGGELQRVALARALVLRPPLLLADEVTGNLDEKTALGIHDLLFALNAAHRMTLVVVTHSPQLATRMPRQLRLAHGQLTPANSAATDAAGSTHG